MRLFHGAWTVGPFHCHPFKLEKRGDHTILHAHKNDHLIQADKKIAVYAVLPAGVERVDHVGAFDRRLVRGGVDHLILALEDDTECECIFSRYDENGRLAADPKAQMPYAEACHIENLPETLRAVLVAEGIDG